VLVLVLLAILIVLVGGPLALGVTVGIPAWLAWTGIGMILPPLFWLLVALVLVFVGVFAAVILGALLPRPGWRQCPRLWHQREPGASVLPEVHARLRQCDTG